MGIEYNSDDDDFGLGAAEKNMNFRADMDKQSEDKLQQRAQQLEQKRVRAAVYWRVAFRNCLYYLSARD